MAAEQDDKADRWTAALAIRAALLQVGKMILFCSLSLAAMAAFGLESLVGLATHLLQLLPEQHFSLSLRQSLLALLAPAIGDFLPGFKA